MKTHLVFLMEPTNEEIKTVFECTVDETLKKDRVYCPICKRDYSIWLLTHVCNNTIKCAGRRARVEERYLPDVVLNMNTPTVECEKCELARKALAEPKRGTCPSCQYVGWFLPGDDGLCPGCIAAKNATVTVTKQPRAKKQTTLHIVQKPNISLILKWSCEDKYERLIVFGIIDNKIAESFNTIWCDYTYIQENMQAFSNWLNKLSSSYTLTWAEGRNVDHYHINEIYNNHPITDKHPLGLFI